MKISHELPLCFLKESQHWNNYEYCLPHLLDKYPLYKEFFLKQNRFVIMDNGLFENVEHTIEDLIQKINLIIPDIFIVPDVWNDPIETSHNAHVWMNEYKQHLPKETQLMIVLQGQNFNDLDHVYNSAKIDGYTHFAFNHSSLAYTNQFKHKNKLVNQMLGRIHMVTKFFGKGYLKQDYVHLLGCSLPQEFLYYDEYKIDSVDTSNPIVCGAMDITYEMGGLLQKPTQKIEEFMEMDLNKQYGAITYNINQFKKFCNL
jgi:hypothetical protein